MKLLLTYCFSMVLMLAWGNENFERANELYTNSDYEGAIEAYATIIANGDHSADTYYNLGNAYYRNQELGKAIWAYESALKIEPGHEDALFNLEFANAQTVEKIDTHSHGFGHWLKGIMYSSNVNLWTYTSLGTSILLSLFIILFITMKKRNIRNLSLLASGLLTLILLFSIFSAAYQKEVLLDDSEGVIVLEQVEILVAPTEEAKTSFKLSEGAKIKVISEEGGWYKIELNSNQGWLPKAAILKI